MTLSTSDIIYDWNLRERVGPIARRPFTVFDETLRDGIQNPSVVDPPIEVKMQIVELMNDLGIQFVNVGLPGAGPRAFEDCVRLTEHIRDRKMAIKPCAAGRTHVKDVQAIIDVSQATGVPVSIYTFLGSSPIRLFAEDWDLDFLLRNSGDAIRQGKKAGLEVAFVTEDTTRSNPHTLDPLFRHAIDCGADRLVLCDTVGHATPDGLKNLIHWTRNLLEGAGASHVGLDWHGHNDRGLGVTLAIHSLEAGVDRVHGTALGIGERVGNTSLDQFLVNMKLLGEWEHDLSKLSRYCQLVSDALRIPIPMNYPVVGKDAFCTATGVHAAAIIKAKKKADDWLADRIYSGVPAGMFGKRQVIQIGHQSGVSNVEYWLRERGLPTDESTVQRIFQYAKSSNRVLNDDEVLALVHGR